MSLKELMELAELIKNKELRKKVKEVLLKPALSNPNFKYRPASLTEVPASINWHHIERGGLIKHTVAVTKLCIKFAEVYEEVYGKKLDKDSLIAAALLHDIGKLWTYEKKGKAWRETNINLDHTMLGTAELYARGFPESVIHIVASHFGENGPTPPQTPEAILFHYIDTMDAVMEGNALQEAILRIF